MLTHFLIIRVTHPGDDDPVRMGCCPRAGVGQTFGQGIELVAAVEAPGEAGQVALGVLGADVALAAVMLTHFLIIRVTHPAMMTRYGWGAVRAQA